MTGKKGIEYSDLSWNPFSGCFGIENGSCAVGKKCWAYGMTFRLRGRCGYEIAKPFRPTFHEDQLLVPLTRKKPTIYNSCFMGDIGYAKKEWMEKILDVVKQCPQHRFIFLTKEPLLLAEKKLEFPDNCIVGVTVNRKDDVWRIGALCREVKARWFWASFEPLYGEIKNIDMFGLEWIVIGAQSNPDLQPETKWVNEIIRCAEIQRIPIFMKPNLETKSMMVQELPLMLKQVAFRKKE